MPVVATGVVVDAIAVTNVEAVLGAIPPDRALHEPRKRRRERRIELPRINVRREQAENAGASSRPVAAVSVRMVGGETSQDCAPSILRCPVGSSFAGRGRHGSMVGRVRRNIECPYIAGPQTILGTSGKAVIPKKWAEADTSAPAAPERSPTLPEPATVLDDSAEPVGELEPAPKAGASERMQRAPAVAENLAPAPVQETGSLAADSDERDQSDEPIKAAGASCENGPSKAPLPANVGRHCGTRAGSGRATAGTRSGGREVCAFRSFSASRRALRGNNSCRRISRRRERGRRGRQSMTSLS
jgi:hypothetical protein